MGLRTVFFSDFTIIFAISKIVLDLTVICRFIKITKEEVIKLVGFETFFRFKNIFGLALLGFRRVKSSSKKYVTLKRKTA